MNKEQLKNTWCYEVYDIIRKGIKKTKYRILPVKTVISKEFYKTFGHPLNWENPCDLNEKINWLKLYSDTSLWTELSDKYKVREYIKEKGLSHILVKLYGCWNNAEDIDFDKLPQSFVLKTNNGSGDVIVVKDKSEINMDKIRKELNIALKQKFGYSHGEPHYLMIKPCIIAEQYLEQSSDSYTTSIVDYKIWCFNGKPNFIWTCYSRSKDGVLVETRDLDWNYHPEKSVFTHHYKDGKGIVPKPKCLSQMIDIAAKLSYGFPQVRVDLYEIEGRVYFGEMTFTSNGGFNNFYTAEFLNELGSLIKLPKPYDRKR